MALQVALNRLRHAAKDGAREKKDERELLAPAQKSASNLGPSSSSVPLFRVDEAELFNFSDDDFLAECDDPFHTSLPPPLSPLPPPPPSTTSPVESTPISSAVTGNSSRSLNTGETTQLDTLHRQTQNNFRNHLSSLHESDTITCGSSSASFSQSACGSTNSTPSSKTREKLKNFKFVKVSKSNYVHPSKRHSTDDQSDVTPPPSKRRPVCNDVTNRCPIKSKNDATNVEDVNSRTEHAFKQPSFNPREGLNSSVTLSQSDPSKGQRANLTVNQQQARGTSSNPSGSSTIPTSITTPSRGLHVPVLSTPSQTSIASSGMTSTPLSSSLSASQRITVTPQPPGHVTCTPIRARQTTPLVSTPTGSVATPTSRVSVPMRRRFPGPAGLLPSLVPGQNMSNLYIPPPSTPTPASTPREKRLSYSTPSLTTDASTSQCAQEDMNVFTQSPWTDMLHDLDLNDEQSSTLLQYNIASALKQASSKQLRNGKVLHLRSLIKSIIPAGKNASAVLKDPTGEVMCTIHSRVVEDHQKELHPGAVLVLRQVSVFSPSPRKHYFNITPSNIVRIYSAHSSDGQKQPRLPLTFSDVVGEEMDENTNTLSQCHTSSRENNFTKNSHSAGSLSQTEHTRRDSCTHNSQLHVQPPSFHSSGSKTVIGRSLNDSQSLTRGAAVVLATRKATSKSSLDASKSHTQTAEDGVMSSNKPVSQIDEMLMDDLPCDFGDFSDDESTDAVSSSPALTEGDPAGVLGNRRESGPAMEGGATMVTNSRDSGFFSKLCEDEFDTLFNDISADGLDF